MPKTIPDNLRSAFVNKTLVPIVGAGVSMSLKDSDGERLFPSWKELLELAAKKLEGEGRLDFAAAIRAELELGKYQLAADHARDGLRGALWNKFFKETFAVERAAIDDTSLQLPQAIWQLSERLITLNYDRVLRFACPRGDDLMELDNTNQSELTDFNRAGHSEPTLWHLHGRLGNMSSIIFTSESYDKLYLEKNSAYKAALEIFRAICRDSTLLFVGCSLSDAELLQQLGSVHKIFGENTGPHYAMVLEKDEPLIREKLKDFKNVELLSFAELGQSLIDKITAIVMPSSPCISSVPALGVPTSVSSISGADVTRHARGPIESPRIAVLSANPIGKNYQYDSFLFKEIKSFKCEVSYLPLNVKSLNSLDGFNYIVIVTKLVKKRIAIEDEMLKSQFISFKELENNISNSTTDGVLVFLDHIDASALDSSDVETLTLPTLIFPALTKAQTDSLAFKLFKKADLSAFSDTNVYAIAQRIAFKLVELRAKYIEVRRKSKLPDSIDPKTTDNYIGRSTDLENICRRIVELQEKNLVLTIKGSGGIGKTITIKRIAVELAARSYFADGIDFIDCEFIPDYSTFEKKVAANFDLENALNIREQIKDNFTKKIS